MAENAKNLDQIKATQALQARQDFERQMLVNLEASSRTRQGVSDTSSSADKPKLSIEGSDLVKQAAENFQQALALAWEHRNDEFQIQQEVRQLIELLAATVSKGLLKECQSLWRTWQTEFNQTSPEKIEEEVDEFCQQMSGRLAQKIDPVTTAAWIEQRFDSQIHPLADGCGRTTKLLSAMVLARNNRSLPHYRGREEYYQQIVKPFPEWEQYYRSLFTEGGENAG